MTFVTEPTIESKDSVGIEGKLFNLVSRCILIFCFKNEEYLLP